jgi:hypothetical protein
MDLNFENGFQMCTQHVLTNLKSFSLIRNDAQASGVFKTEANEQLPISFEALPIEIFISRFTLFEILLFQNCLFSFELDSNYIFFSCLNFTCTLHLNRK